MNADRHGDVLKAKHVMILLMEHGVQIVAGKSFGPNINRIVVRFLPVVMRHSFLEDCLREIQVHLDDILKTYGAGVERQPFLIR